MPSIWDLANPQLRNLAVYEPGKPIEETARELGADPNDIIKLASNENPLGPSPKAVDAMQRAIQTIHLYPDGGAFYLRTALGASLGLTPQHLILGNGSNEVIEFLCHAFVMPGDDIITPRYAFIAYKIIATVFGAQTIETEAPDFEPDLDAVLAAITPRTRLIFIANPNNPTGTLIPRDKIDNFMSRLPDRVVTVFDEAYYEFLAEPVDMLRYVRQQRNVVLLRTFSKIHGLAGLRIGYGIAHPELIGVLQKAREPFNVNSMAQIGALAALDDIDHQQRSRRVVDEGRAWLENQLSLLGLTFVPAAANFIMVNVGEGVAVFQQMLKQKVIVRPLRGYGLPEWIRISVGTPEQNQRCIEALRELVPHVQT